MHLTPVSNPNPIPIPRAGSSSHLGFNSRLIEPELVRSTKKVRCEMYRNDDINRSNQRKRTTNDDELARANWTCSGIR